MQLPSTMTGSMDKGRAVEMSCSKFSKASGVVTLNVFRPKVMICGLQRRSIKQVENSLGCPIKKINGTKSNWWPVTKDSGSNTEGNTMQCLL